MANPFIAQAMAARAKTAPKVKADAEDKADQKKGKYNAKEEAAEDKKTNKKS